MAQASESALQTAHRAECQHFAEDLDKLGVPMPKIRQPLCRKSGVRPTDERAVSRQVVEIAAKISCAVVDSGGVSCFMVAARLRGRLELAVEADVRRVTHALNELIATVP